MRIDRKTGDGMGRQETTLFDRMVYAVPVVLVFMFLVVYFSSGMVATLDNSMQVYWRGDGQPYQEGNSVRQCAVMDGEWHNYEFDTAGAGSVRVRLDPVGDGRLARRIEIRRIAYIYWQEQHLAGGRSGVVALRELPAGVRRGLSGSLAGGGGSVAGAAPGRRRGCFPRYDRGANTAGTPAPMALAAAFYRPPGSES